MTNKKILSYGYGLGMVMLLLVFAVSPISAQPTAAEFGVNDAIGNPETYVTVPVNITNAQNGPIPSIRFDILYNNSILSVAGVQKGHLTSTWDAPYSNNFDWGTRISATYDGVESHAIQNGSTGSVVLLNFSVIGAAGSTSGMNLTDIQLSDLSGMEMGTAPAKNGTFRVDAGAPSVTNPNANPDTIVANGTHESRLNVTVVDDIAVDVVVTANLTQIGGPAEKIMEKSDDTLYSTTTNASIGTTPGTYYLPINATDLLGNYNNTVNITLNIIAPENGSIAGNITYSNNGTGILGVNVSVYYGVEGIEVGNTTTNETGYYTFTNVPVGDCHIKASKLTFWDNSTDVVVIADEIAEAETMMLWLKGDLNNNVISADAGDLVLMKRASVGEITGDWKYDLNENDMIADAGDLVLMKRASVGEIVLI